MKNVYILLYRGKSLISKLIRWQTRSIYSHASIYIEGEGNIEAWHIGGVRMKDSYCDGHKSGTIIDVFSVDLSDEEIEKIVEYAKSKIGKKYDFRSVFRFLTRKPQNEHDKDKWFCSELVFASFKYAGINLLERIEAWAVSPALLSFSPKMKKVTTWVCLP